MVMDAQPSPQSVGREFVRQYYTLLNRAPNHLFRFYNNHSIFFHDGLDAHSRDVQPAVVIGQKEIHHRIQQLNFRDVHAKISQVDAQATLGNGVVVQVTGELSNDGQPMRRFTQTFVLAPQSPKNYYVHNDIFRYQDVYSDDENDGESRSENDEEQETSLESKMVDGAQQQQTMGQPQLYYPMPPTATSGAVHTHPPGVGQTIPMAQFGAQQPPAQVNGVVHDELLQASLQQPSQAAPLVPPTTVEPSAVQVPVVAPTATSVPASVPAIPLTSLPTAVTAPLNATPSPLEPIVSKESLLTQSPNLQQQPHQNTSSPEMLNDALKQENDMGKKDDFKSALDHSDKNDINKMTQNEPKTYANLFKSMSGNSGFHSVPPMNQPYSAQPTVNKPQEQRPDSIQQNAGLPQRNNSQRQAKEFSERRTSNTNTQFGDSHQLFLGNVPHHATEEELKALFSKFGAVVDLRIHSKPASKLSGVRMPPNYGFITYEDPESVQNCLANCPLYFPDNSPDGQKLNVEEKKTRLRGSNDMPRLSNNMSSGGSGMGNSQRPSGPNRSLSNSGGMMRGSSGGSGGGPVRGTAGGPRPSGGFPRNDRGGPGGPPNRGNNGNGTAAAGGGNTYGRR